MSFTVDFSRLRLGELLAGAGGLALFGFLFMDWYASGEFDLDALSGWDVVTDFPGFLVCLAGLVAIKFAGMTALGMRVNWGLPRGAMTLALGWLASAIILWRMVAGSPELEVGIVLSLVATLAITVGAWLALREDGFETLVPIAGTRSRKRG